MAEPWTGGCACGAVRYRAAGEPRYMVNCHCRDCQRATGSAYTPALLIDDGTLELSGTPAWYEVRADSGRLIRRAFCGRCGSPLFLANEERPNMRWLYAGSLDDPERFTPQLDMFVASAQPWDIMHADLPKVDGQPDD